VRTLLLRLCLAVGSAATVVAFTTPAFAAGAGAPRGVKAAVVMTDDDDGAVSTSARFNSFGAASPAGCSITDWQCVRVTSYAAANAPIAAATAASYDSAGVEIALQLDASFPGVAAPKIERTRCSVWSEFASAPPVEFVHHMRFDTNYGGHAFFNGTGMPMQFADASGTTVDVYQAPTQMIDGATPNDAASIAALLDSALGRDGCYAAVTASVAANADANAIVAAAQARGVPVVSARQLREWLDGRNNSAMQNMAWNGTTLSFTVAVGEGANGLQAMLPAANERGLLQTLTLNGNPVAFEFSIVKGVAYVRFAVALGTYQAGYAP